MRSWRRLAAVASLLCLCLPVAAKASDGGGKPWLISIGAFLPTDEQLCGVDTKTGVSLALGHVFRQTENFAVIGSVRWSRYDLDNKQWVTLWSPTLEYRLLAGKSLYGAVGVGTVFGANNGGGHTWSLAYEIGAGVNLSSSIFIDVRAVRGTKTGEHGLVLSAGLRL